MVSKCIICKAPKKKGIPLSFHRFPADENRRRAWIKACKMKENDLKPTSIICSKHFIEDDFDSVYVTHRLFPTAVPSPSGDYCKAKTTTKHPLKVNVRQNVEKCSLVDVAKNSNISMVNDIALRVLTSKESVHTSTPEELKTGSMRGNLNCIDFDCAYCADVQHQETVFPTDKEMNNIPNKISHYICDLQPEHFGSPKSAKRNLEFIKKIVTEQRKKIKILQVQKRRLELSLKDVNELIVHLRDKKLLSEEASEAVLIHINKHITD